MKRNFYYLILFSCLVDVSAIFAQDAFTVHLIPSSLTSVPAVHSGAFAEYNGKWIFMGGRRDGLHIMQANQAFPSTDRNDTIYIVDPLNNSMLSAAASQLPVYLFSAISSANMQFYQEGKFLYLIGGYGYEDSSQAWITFPSLVSVDLDSLENAINAGASISGSFRLLIDSNMAVTGGALDKIDSTYYLVFGHKFDGRYAKMQMPIFTQRYTHEIRKFSIHDDGINLSVSNYSALSDTNLFHRRDFNLVPQVFLNHDRGFTVFGGVFQKMADLPFLTPIDITSGGVQHQQSFNENLNQYTTATLPVYDSSYNFMHTVFFGGMSLYTLDTINLALVQDTLIPFVNTISMVSRDASGQLIESKLQENMPALKGTNAIFISDINAPTIDGRIINLNSISGNTRVGFLVGGIHSDAPNIGDLDPVSMSRPNSIVYEVYIDKNVNAIPEVNVTNAVNNLIVYPNPAVGNLYMNFLINGSAECEIVLLDSKGSHAKNLLPSQALGGQQSLIFKIDELEAGNYYCRVRVGNSVKIVKVIIGR